MKYLINSLLIFSFLIVGAGCSSNDVETDMTDNKTTEVTNNNIMTYEFPGVLDADQIKNKQVRISTDKGDIVFTLFADTAPMTVSNFVSLANHGYYDGLTFHRRVEGFVIQGGDPNGDGTGGPGYSFADELDDEYTYKKGIVAMANSGADTNGSQFFVMLEDYDLPKAYSIFGDVIEGQDIVDQIEIGDVMNKVTVENINDTSGDVVEKDDVPVDNSGEASINNNEDPRVDAVDGLDGDITK